MFGELVRSCYNHLAIDPSAVYLQRVRQGSVSTALPLRHHFGDAMGRGIIFATPAVSTTR